MSTLFSSVELAPRDPILGITEQYNADTRAEKVNLGVGVYYDDHGKVPLLAAVQRAEEQLLASKSPRTYLPIDGLKNYDSGAQKLLLGQDHALVAQKRAITFQALGGTGGLKIGADFLKTLVPDSTVYISNPSWENHRAIFERAGFNVQTYPYYDATTHGVDFDAMLAFLRTLPSRSIVLLHACCHNPTGAELSTQQWQMIASVMQERDLIPFLDIAYQGFGQGLQEDAYAVRLFADMGFCAFISSSFSKSFSLYGERVGALTILTQSEDESVRVLSQVKRVIRTNYSNPPTHGAAVVSTVLNTPELFQLWEDELAAMRVRIRSMREQLVHKLADYGVQQDFRFVLAQSGMFSYSGLTAAQVERLMQEFGVYAVKSGRICVAALNSRNIDYVAKAIATVL